MEQNDDTACVRLAKIIRLAAEYIEYTAPFTRKKPMHEMPKSVFVDVSMLFGGQLEIAVLQSRDMQGVFRQIVVQRGNEYALLHDNVICPKWYDPDRGWFFDREEIIRSPFPSAEEIAEMLRKLCAGEKLPNEDYRVPHGWVHVLETMQQVTKEYADKAEADDRNDDDLRETIRNIGRVTIRRHIE